MEALAAVSLAGSVVQFVEFSCKFLSEGRQLYQSSSGKLESNEEVELIVEDLRTVITKLRQSSQGKSSTGGENSGEALETICRQATKIAEELINKEKKPELPPKVVEANKVKRKVKTFQQLLKSMWSR
jgi:hypothetical protein